MNKNTYDHIKSNDIKTVILVLLFPISLILLFSVVLYILFFISAKETATYIDVFYQTLFYVKHFALSVILIGLAWMLIVWHTGSDMMLGFANALPLKKDTSPETKKIYNLVENTALAAGLPCPKVYIIQDESLNAFATGKTPKTASVALTSGIIKKLNPTELQGVIAHEMAHIGNRDIRLNMMIISGASIFAFLAELLFRISFHSKKSNDQKNSLGPVLLATAITFYLFHTVISPLLTFAVSRTREYAADATASLITRNPEALASALKKISIDSRVESLDSSKSMAIACIHTPLKHAAISLTSTHPPIEDRIKRLNEMAGIHYDSVDV